MFVEDCAVIYVQPAIDTPRYPYEECRSLPTNIAAVILCYLAATVTVMVLIIIIDVIAVAIS